MGVVGVAVGCVGLSQALCMLTLPCCRQRCVRAMACMCGVGTV
jgi:hypothetical protein